MTKNISKYLKILKCPCRYKLSYQRMFAVFHHFWLIVLFSFMSKCFLVCLMICLIHLLFRRLFHFHVSAFPTLHSVIDVLHYSTVVRKHNLSYFSSLNPLFKQAWWETYALSWVMYCAVEKQSVLLWWLEGGLDMH